MDYIIKYSLSGEVKANINCDEIITDTIYPLFTSPEDLEMNQRGKVKRSEVNLERSIVQNLQNMISHEENRLTNCRSRFKKRKY